MFLKKGDIADQDRTPASQSYVVDQDYNMDVSEIPLPSSSGSAAEQQRVTSTAQTAKPQSAPGLCILCLAELASQSSKEIVGAASAEGTSTKCGDTRSKANDCQSQKRKRETSSNDPSDDATQQKFARVPMCSHDTNIYRGLFYLLVKQVNSETAQVINVEDLSTFSITDPRWVGYVFLASKADGWVLMMAPDGRRVCFFNVITRTDPIPLPLLPVQMGASNGTFTSQPSRRDNWTAIMGTVNENGFEVLKLFSYNNAVTGGLWEERTLGGTVDGRRRAHIDGPVIYKDNLIWISNGEWLETTNREQLYNAIQLLGLDNGTNSLFVKHENLFVIKCNMNGLPQMIRVSLEPNPYESIQYQVIQSLAPFDVILIPGQEGFCFSDLYPEIEADQGNELYIATDLDNHLHRLRIYGGQIVEEDNHFPCENCNCQAVFFTL